MKRAVLSYGAHRYILGSPVCLVGRDPDCDLVLDDPSVSRKHAVFVRSGPRFVVLDYKSSNGLFVNDEPVFRAELHHGDVVRLGDESVTFHLQSHFKFGPEVRVENFDGLLTTRDLSAVVEECFADLGTERRGRFDALFLMDEDARGAVSVDELLQRSLARVVEAMGAERGFVALFDEEAGEMDVRAAVGMEASVVPGNHFYVVLMQQAFAGAALVATTDALVEYFYQEPRLIFLGIGSALCAPLLRGGHAVGTLYLDRGMVADGFARSDERLLALFAYRLSLLLDDRLLVDRVKENLQIVDILVTRIGTGGAAIRCEICGEPIEERAVEDLVICLKCHTIHHRDCWTYNGGCPIYGCDSVLMKTLDDV